MKKFSLITGFSGLIGLLGFGLYYFTAFEIGSNSSKTIGIIGGSDSEATMELIKTLKWNLLFDNPLNRFWVATSLALIATAILMYFGRKSIPICCAPPTTVFSLLFSFSISAVLYPIVHYLKNSIYAKTCILLTIVYLLASILFAVFYIIKRLKNKSPKGILYDIVFAIIYFLPFYYVSTLVSTAILHSFLII